MISQALIGFVYLCSSLLYVLSVHFLHVLFSATAACPRAIIRRIKRGSGDGYFRSR